MIYSIFSNPSFINIFIIALLIFLILFLWRKVMILEGNMFILDKRVNLLKKDCRDSAVSRNMQKADEGMQEVFGGNNVCASSGCCFMPMPEVAKAPVNQIEEITILTSVVQEDKNLDDDVQISFTKKEDDAIPDNIIAMVAENTENEIHETMSVASDITFNTDGNKYSQKKLSKMSIDKLRDICTSLNINPEGTKAQLITRILEIK